MKATTSYVSICNMRRAKQVSETVYSRGTCFESAFCYYGYIVLQTPSRIFYSSQDYQTRATVHVVVKEKKNEVMLNIPDNVLVSHLFLFLDRSSFWANLSTTPSKA
jgi:hypothetical protein